MVFTGRRHLFSTPMLSLIRSPLLSIVPKDLTNASLHHAHNSCYLTLRIVLCWQQNKLSQNVLWQILQHETPGNTGKQKIEVIFKTQVVISRQSSLGILSKWQHLGCFSSGRPRHSNKKCWKPQNDLGNQLVKFTPIHFEIDFSTMCIGYH